MNWIKKFFLNNCLNHFSLMSSELSIFDTVQTATFVFIETTEKAVGLCKCDFDWVICYNFLWCRELNKLN